ncbi:MAG: NAD(P)/FAD-dependent oxidoreductase, partial [Bacteroidota bacterium]
CCEVKEPVPGRRPIEAVWYVGKMMGEALGHTLAGKKTAYRPGLWYNSAKFFDIEYQTYGTVLNSLRDNEAQFYWEAPTGDKCVKFVFDKNDKTILGVNTFGIRMRHVVWDKWLDDQRTISYVIENLDEANFDPEFFRKHDTDIQQKYNEEFPNDRVKVRSKGFFEKIFS